MIRSLLALALLALSTLATAQSDRDIVAARVAKIDPALTNEHPRLLLRTADLPALREFARTLGTQPGMAGFDKLMLPPLDAPLIAQPEAVKNGTTEGSSKWRAGYQAANDAGNMAQRHALAWLMTGDERYGREAARWLMHLASWRIDVNVYRTNDELFIQHLRPMIFAYDWAWNALTPDERKAVGRALEERVELLASLIQPKFALAKPTEPDNSLSHPMRFISTLGQGGLVLYHEAKAAPGWLAWSYEYYLRQFPVWGGDAGGWSEGLNYWATGISQHLRFLEGMQLLGFDEPLKRPFWRNTAYFGMYSLMPYPGSSFGDLTNIMGPSPSIALMEEKFALLQRDPYPLAFARKLRQGLPNRFGYYEFDATDALLHRFRLSQQPLPEVDLASLPQSRYFDDIGVVAMHSKLGERDADIMFALRSSPQGSASHSFADQNSFVLNAFGEPLAISSGYREYYDSPHHKGWSRTTRAKNAVLFDGEGQAIKSANAVGRITRFAQGDGYSFVTGDATAAYGRNAKLALRHAFFVDRRFVVMLDELEAPEAIPFQWLLHARERMGVDADSARITQQKGNARLAVQLLSPAPNELEFSQTDRFDPPVVASYEKRMPNEWHVTASTRKPAAQQRFLSVLYPSRAAEAVPAISAVAAERGHAVRVATAGGDTLVWLGGEKARAASAAGAQLQGVAASLRNSAEGSQLALVQATGFTQGELRVTASAAVDMEATLGAKQAVLHVSAAAPVTLTLQTGFVAQKLSGLPAGAWKAEGGQLSLQLPAGESRLRVE
ncbi:MAG: heparinase II/III family protein [Moraxellaceae bacterium]|nr:heparinase II/III family protein [Moraxellaceae bacterium]